MLTRERYEVREKKSSKKVCFRISHVQNCAAHYCTVEYCTVLYSIVLLCLVKALCMPCVKGSLRRVWLPSLFLHATWCLYWCLYSIRVYLRIQYKHHVLLVRWIPPT